MIFPLGNLLHTQIGKLGGQTQGFSSSLKGVLLSYPQENEKL